MEGNLFLRSKKSSTNIFLSSGDGMGFEVFDLKHIFIETKKEVDFLLFSMPYL